LHEGMVEDNKDWKLLRVRAIRYNHPEIEDNDVTYHLHNTPVDTDIGQYKKGGWIVLESKQPKEVTASLIILSEPLWINADKNSDMHIKLSVTNKHSFSVTNVVIKFKFQDVAGKDLGGAKIKTLNEIFKADEVQEILKLSLDDYPSETIKVIAEVISVSPND
jgi:hypothetical protein